MGFIYLVVSSSSIIGATLLSSSLVNQFGLRSYSFAAIGSIHLLVIPSLLLAGRMMSSGISSCTFRRNQLHPYLLFVSRIRTLYMPDLRSTYKSSIDSMFCWLYSYSSSLTITSTPAVLAVDNAAFVANVFVTAPAETVPAAITTPTATLACAVSLRLHVYYMYAVIAIYWTSYIIYIYSSLFFAVVVADLSFVPLLSTWVELVSCFVVVVIIITNTTWS